MGVKRIVDTDFWSDTTVLDKYTPEDKYFMLYILTNPHTKQCGIYKLPKKYISFETGYNSDTIDSLINRFEKTYKNIIYDHSTQEIAILNYLKYSVIKGGKPVYDCISADLEKVKNKNLIKIVYKHLDSFFKTSTKQSYKAIEQIFKEKIELYLKDNDNDNDIYNDNDSIVDDSSDDSSHPQNNSSNFLNEKLDKDFGKVATLYQQIIGQPNALTPGWISAILEDYGFDWVKNAMLEAEKKGKRNKSYIEGILQNWKRDGGMKLGGEFDGTHRQGDRDGLGQYKDIGITV